MNCYEITSLLISAVSAIGTIAAGFGAIFAVAQIRKHWRDDDTRAVILPERQRNCTTREGKVQTISTVRIVNVGKVDFTPYKLTLSDTRLEERFKIVSTLAGQYILCQGAYCEATAIVTAKENGIVFPEHFDIVLVSAEGKELCKHTVKPVDSSATS